jgi:hypothetical protein
LEKQKSLEPKLMTIKTNTEIEVIEGRTISTEIPGTMG